MNDRSAIDEIRTRLDIVDVIGETVALKKAGNTYKGLCPFHSEKSPSFNVNRERGLFKCFGCGESGDIFAFVMKTTGITFPEALRELARRAGVTLKSSGRTDSGVRDAIHEMNAAALAFFTRNLLEDSGAEARAYLAKRGIDDAMIRRFQIGLALAGWDEFLKIARNRFPPEALKASGLVRERESGGFYDLFRDRIIFPIFDTASRPVAFGAREYHGEERGPKYINSPETPLYTKGRHLYALNLAKEAIKRSGRAVLVEGYTDVILAHRAGFSNVIAALGTALTDEQVASISRLGREIVLAYDMDAAGQKAADRGIDIALNRGLAVRVADLPEGEDPADTLLKREPTVFARALESARDFLDHRIESRLRTASSAIERARDAKELTLSLKGIADRVLRAALIHTIAERFGVPENALLTELEASSARPAGGKDAGAERAAAEDGRSGAASFRDAAKPGEAVRPGDAGRLRKIARGLDPELAILRLMLDDREIRARAAADLDPADFSKPVRAGVFTGILEAAAAGEDLRGDLGGRVEGLGLELLAHIATAPFDDADRVRLYHDYRRTVRMRGIDARITDCTVQLQRPGLSPGEKATITMRLSALLKEKSDTMTRPPRKSTDITAQGAAPGAAQGAGLDREVRHDG
jgi:DNA primase